MCDPSDSPGSCCQLTSGTACWVRGDVSAAGWGPAPGLTTPVFIHPAQCWVIRKCNIAVTSSLKTSSLSNLTCQLHPSRRRSRHTNAEWPEGAGLEQLLPVPAAWSPRRGVTAQRAPRRCLCPPQPSACAKWASSGAWEGDRGMCRVPPAQAASRSLSQVGAMAVLSSQQWGHPPIAGVCPPALATAAAPAQ